MLNDKFNLTLAENVFVAKKLISETIYNTARLEDCAVTFPQTETILQGVSVAGLMMSDVEKILNLRDAWRYTLETIEKPISLELWSTINGYVARNESLEWGVLRYGNVGISGTDYKPKIPKMPEIISEIQQMLNCQATETATEKALNLFLYGCRSQLFWDGNKRTSTIIANKHMIKNGVGIFSIPSTDLPQFNTLLTHFYTTNESHEIKKFLHENCIKGMTK
ncbi:MAG: death-on-curing protein [Defluviitaleaceae bacterium]|nr:death-on-curing protein [Defluviitaleaceae bacterium]